MLKTKKVGGFTLAAFKIPIKKGFSTWTLVTFWAR